MGHTKSRVWQPKHLAFFLCWLHHQLQWVHRSACKHPSEQDCSARKQGTQPARQSQVCDDSAGKSGCSECTVASDAYYFGAGGFGKDVGAPGACGAAGRGAFPGGLGAMGALPGTIGALPDAFADGSAAASSSSMAVKSVPHF